MSVTIDWWKTDIYILLADDYQPTVHKTNNIIEAAEEVLLRNRRTTGRFTFTIPSTHEYRHQWLWDSCFHAIALRHFDTAAAEKELLSLMASQHRDGMIPHESKYVLFGIKLPFTSRVTQPPLIARAALDVYSKGRNKDFLAEIFPGIRRYHHWLEMERETGGILKFVDSNESGEDNSITWDDEYHIPVHKTYLRWLTTYLPLYPQKAMVKSASGTSVYADALECAAKIARALGNAKLSSSYRRKHDAVISAMARTFRREDGIYYSQTHTGKPILHKSHEMFSPLFAAAVKKRDAKALVEEHLLNRKEFWTRHAIPTVAANEPKFSPTGYWRGPMWININWMLYRGLLRYGLKAVAEELLQKTTAAIRKSGFREYYNPHTGEGLGAKDFGWSTLVVDMMLEK